MYILRTNVVLKLQTDEVVLLLNNTVCFKIKGLLRSSDPKTGVEAVTVLIDEHGLILPNTNAYKADEYILFKDEKDRWKIFAPDLDDIFTLWPNINYYDEYTLQDKAYDLFIRAIDFVSNIGRIWS